MGSNNKKKKIEKVVGGTEPPEEFDWQTKGYETAVKDHTNDPGWAFTVIDQENDLLIKKHKKNK